MPESTPTVEDGLDCGRTPALKWFEHIEDYGNYIERCEVVDMASASSNKIIVFTRATRELFSQNLLENPHNRRVTQSDKNILIEWLTNPHKRPVSQEEFSRRNYVRKTFAWDEENQTLLAAAKKDEGRSRTVVTTDMIAEVVETVHTDNGHAGWDATWRDVSTSYYGILRSDVIFLLKQCQICAQNPSKRPKGSPAAMLQPQHIEHESLDFLNTDDVQYDESAVDKQENDRSITTGQDMYGDGSGRFSSGFGHEETGWDNW